LISINYKSLKLALKIFTIKLVNFLKIYFHEKDIKIKMQKNPAEFDKSKNTSIGGFITLGSLIVHIIHYRFSNLTY
jgi:hypothetical protein